MVGVDEGKGGIFWGMDGGDVVSGVVFVDDIGI